MKELYQLILKNLTPVNTIKTKLRIKAKGLNLLMVVGAVALILILWILIYKAIVNGPIYHTLANSKNFTPKDINKTQDLASLNQIFELPEDQNGVMGTIKDVKPLEQRQAYFSKARPGDILIIYPDLTIIYDPVNHTVVDISKVSLLE